MSKKSFIANFWREKKMVGAMAPSSPFLAKKMLESVDFNSAKVIVELGPGTGVFTERIIKNMRKDAVLLVFELNDNFMNSLKHKIRDPRVHLIHDSAEKIGEYLSKFNCDKADAVVSSLPLANFPEELKNSILKESHLAMKDNAIYVQFQYSLNAKKEIKAVFNSVKIAFTPVNIPPAFVYKCRK